MKNIVFLISLLFSMSVMSADISTPKAVLQAMDKVTGRVQKIEIAVGQTIHFGEIDIHLEKCLKKPPEEMPENAAFLKIYYAATPEKEVFKGWMFSSNPALSAMEDPVYDIWVDSCKENQPEVVQLPEVIQESEEQTEIAEDPNEPIED